MIMKVVSQLWNKMSDQEKAGYKVMSDSDRKRFDEEKKLHKKPNRKGSKGQNEEG